MLKSIKDTAPGSLCGVVGLFFFGLELRNLSCGTSAKLAFGKTTRLTRRQAT